MQMRTLPTGFVTLDSDEYAEAWVELARPVEGLMDWSLHSFDPNVTFLTGGGEVERLPTALLLRLYPLLTGEEFPS